jgi:flagellar biosynthesis protein FlhG
VIDQAQKLREKFASVKVRHGPGAPAGAPAGAPEGACRSVAVTSGKGGVGKTNICLSLGITLAMMKKKVLVLDADLGLANIHILLGISPGRTMEHYARNECALHEAIIEGPSGVHILPGASGLESMADMEPLRLGILTRELAALEQSYDFLLIDTGAGIGRIAAGFASTADVALLVVTPEPTSLADAYAMVKVLYKKRELPVSVIVNMAASDKDGVETFDRLNALVVRFLERPLDRLGIIPFDKQVGSAVRRQSAMVVAHPHTVFAARVQQACRVLCGVPPAQKENFFSRMLKKH